MLPHVVPSLAVMVAPVEGRYLDRAPYNNLTLSCLASVTVQGVGAPSSISFTWSRSVGTSPPTALPPSTSTDASAVASTDTSTLTVPTEVAGNHTYFCEAILDVFPAPDDISQSEMAILEVIGQCREAWVCL